MLIFGSTFSIKSGKVWPAQPFCNTLYNYEGAPFFWIAFLFGRGHFSRVVKGFVKLALHVYKKSISKRIFIWWESTSVYTISLSISSVSSSLWCLRIVLSICLMPVFLPNPFSRFVVVTIQAVKCNFHQLDNTCIQVLSLLHSLFFHSVVKPNTLAPKNIVFGSIWEAGRRC